MTPPRRKKSDQEPAVDTPIYLGNYSNGEMFHWQTERERRIREYVLKEAGERARRHGIDRRSFLSSAMGMALTLGALELGQGCSSSKSKRGMDPGGNFDATEPDDADACEAVLSPGDTFIFDVQTHHIDRVTSGNASFLNGISYAHCGKGLLGCLGFDEFLELVFLESDTTVAILTTVPFKPQDIPLSNTDIIRSMDAVNGAAKGTQRLLNHCAVLPNYDTENQLVMMEDVAKSRGVVGWKSYTSWRPSSTGPGYWLDDDVGRAFIEKARSLGPKIFSTHKGLPLTSSDPAYLDPQDIPRAAKLYPDCSFIVYHSAYHFGGSTEGPFERVGATARVGTNSLINSMMDSEVGPNENVYAELGTTWGAVMRTPTKAAHLLGKLIKYVGEDNVLWGTDAIWGGSPQPQIEAFMAFQISPEFQEQYGYPALTKELKAKILGLNAARLYDIDVSATRCAVKNGPLADAKRELDERFGKRRWATRRPAIQTWQDYVANARAHEKLGLPG